MPQPHFQRCGLTAGRADPTLPTVSEAELLYGVEILIAGGRRDRLIEAVKGMLRADIDERILPFDSTAAYTYAEGSRLARFASWRIARSRSG